MHALLLLIQVVQYFQGYGGKGQPHEGIIVGEEITIPPIGVAMAADDTCTVKVSVARDDDGGMPAKSRMMLLPPLWFLNDDYPVVPPLTPVSVTAPAPIPIPIPIPIPASVPVSVPIPIPIPASVPVSSIRP
jgi:hypothetical protein